MGRFPWPPCTVTTRRKRTKCRWPNATLLIWPRINKWVIHVSRWYIEKKRDKKDFITHSSFWRNENYTTRRINRAVRNEFLIYRLNEFTTIDCLLQVNSRISEDPESCWFPTYCKTAIDADRVKMKITVALKLLLSNFQDWSWKKSSARPYRFIFIVCFLRIQI